MYSTEIFSSSRIYPESITHFYKEGNLDNEPRQESGWFFASRGRITFFSGRRLYNWERHGCFEINIDGTIVKNLHNHLISFTQIKFIIPDSRIVETELIIGFGVHKVIITVVRVEKFRTG